MGTAQTDNFRLRWNDFEANLSSAFRDLRQNDDFFDVTLATCPPEDAGAADVKGAIDQEAQAVLRAHKLVLSACSPFFRNLLRGHASLLPHPHPVIYLRGVKPKDLANVLDFMYHGEVNVAQDDLESFLAAAEDLKVKGLTENNQASSSSGHDDQHTPQHTPQHQQPRQRQQQHTHTPSSASSGANPLRMPKNGPGSVNKGKGIKRPGQDAGLVGGVTPKKLPKTAPSSASSSASTQQSLHPSESDSHAAAEDDDDDILEVTAVKVEASSAASGSGQQGTSHTHTLKSEEAMLADEDELAPEDYLEEGGDYDEGNYDEGAYDEQGEGKMMEAAGGAGGAVGAGDGQGVLLPIHHDLVNLASEVNFYLNSITSSAGGSSFQCLACAKVFNQLGDYRRHLLLHLQTDRPMLEQRLDAFVRSNVLPLDGPGGGFSCMICKRVLKLKMKQVRAHFVAVHLRQRDRK